MATWTRRTVRPLLKGLRRTGRALGTVRDLDVAGERVRAFEESVSGSEGMRADGLVQAWSAERKRARKRLCAYLAGKQYDSWKRETRAFLQSELDSQPLLDRRGEPRAYRLRHVVPVAVYARYGEVLAFDDWVSGDEPPAERLHQLRIAAKACATAWSSSRDPRAGGTALDRRAEGCPGSPWGVSRRRGRLWGARGPARGAFLGRRESEGSRFDRGGRRRDRVLS